MLMQIVDLLLQLRCVSTARTNQYLCAGLAIVTRGRELQCCSDGLAITVSQLQVQFCIVAGLVVEVAQESFQFGLLRLVYHIDD